MIMSEQGFVEQARMTAINIHVAWFAARNTARHNGSSEIDIAAIDERYNNAYRRAIARRDRRLQAGSVTWQMGKY